MTKGKKKKILKAAEELGCDLDGDYIFYKGILYFINAINDYVEKMNTTYETPWRIRRKLVCRAFLQPRTEDDT